MRVLAGLVTPAGLECRTYVAIGPVSLLLLAAGTLAAAGVSGMW